MIIEWLLKLDALLDEEDKPYSSHHSSNKKVKLFRENILVIGGKWYDDKNLTDDATFPTALIKPAKSRFNQKINSPCDTN